MAITDNQLKGNCEVNRRLIRIDPIFIDITFAR